MYSTPGRYSAGLGSYNTAGRCRAQLHPSVALLTGVVVRTTCMQRTVRACADMQAWTQHTSLVSTVMTYKHVEIWLSLEFMTVAKSGFLPALFAYAEIWLMLMLTLICCERKTLFIR